ncbi:hypothetical protein RA229_003628 [Cronobacter sakazakii]|nr:hypothetical protein [Cronobacter sakazakii]EKY1902722.1 hypothetical protein [Cronobacter sakazakii]EKY1907323.1 hypothetical protein [Cronobacter sakazakii]EKY1909840.1 hypothetical protein [Cronobacter sakazakii]EKY1913967.1 hypothetical protein [Cronobacter sakazakii]EKY1922576.1 hypothetical protein [Cronobacter sakazakii]
MNTSDIGSLIAKVQVTTKKIKAKITKNLFTSLSPSVIDETNPREISP